ncbi:hypothetical protein GCM10010259_19850 [Streptomyces daghestanicus]|uniref:Uncharacterized protein n=2 Tax=Streptomyces TaxID=1883 RepID=A0A918GEZ9_STRGD|nr:hypothetical protein GCM10010238_21320 [Streptomyces niveoruber]GGS88521.1 hypothetical protein GCM10010240_22470 [Streptomyces griseoviridis]GGU29436.1 hypothetical protein GCM10010259_19850 [Streptomyces daghestanicus]GHI34877.1 hypothetical protein Sdagh_66070 [Streptomyces daghestanicus]
MVRGPQGVRAGRDRLRQGQTCRRRQDREDGVRHRGGHLTAREGPRMFHEDNGKVPLAGARPPQV